MIMLYSLSLTTLLLLSNHVNSRQINSCSEINSKNQILKLIQRNILNGRQVFSLNSIHEWKVFREKWKIEDYCGDVQNKHLTVVTKGKFKNPITPIG